MTWLAESLGMKGRETPDVGIRRYLADRFFKDHLQTYKKRPIYWLFCSGRQRAFQALVYLHRYNEGTLARLRARYVVPLIAKISARRGRLEGDADAPHADLRGYAPIPASAAARARIQKQIESLRRQQVELLAYDQKLCRYADMGLALDLDEGVKVNYARFGDLVAESKAITGGGDD
jgi:type II restriction/modification system DNA methylase subunit YeeA